MTRPSLSCDEVEELLPLVADGTLDEVSDPTLFMHVVDCERCQQSLNTHDLIALSLPSAGRLSCAGRLPQPRITRPWWQRAVPATMAASLLVGGTWLAVGSRELAGHEAASGARSVAIQQASQQAGPVAAIAKPAPVTAVTAPKAIAPKASVRQSSAEVEVEVVALPGSTTAHPHYLVRRGEQVLLVTPQVAPAEMPSDARQALFSPNRY